MSLPLDFPLFLFLISLLRSLWTGFQVDCFCFLSGLERRWRGWNRRKLLLRGSFLLSSLLDEFFLLSPLFRLWIPCNWIFVCGFWKSRQTEGKKTEIERGIFPNFFLLWISPSLLISEVILWSLMVAFVELGGPFVGVLMGFYGIFCGLCGGGRGVVGQSERRFCLWGR